MSDWRLIDGRTTESGEGQLIVKRDGPLDVGAIVARIYENTEACGEWTPTARILAAAPELARLTADLSTLTLGLAEALTDHHAGTTTQDYQATVERDEELLARGMALVSEALAHLRALAEGEAGAPTE